jgi:hypothetical protein
MDPRWLLGKARRCCTAAVANAPDLTTTVIILAPTSHARMRASSGCEEPKQFV